MDSKSDFLNSIIALLTSINEEYIIGISNKGIFNRAQKDLKEAGGLSCTVEDKSVSCALPDGTICVVTEDIKNYKCTCPSRSLCKHVVMSYLYLKENMASIFPQNIAVAEQVTVLDFQWLKDISFDEIKKLVGEKNLQQIIRRIKFGVVVSIDEGALITVNFVEEEIFVKLTAGVMENSTCSCKAKTFCNHLVEAIVHYKLFKGFISEEEVFNLDSSTLEVDKKIYEPAFYELRKTIEDILITGVARLPLSMEDRLEQIAVICHNFQLPNFEKAIREIQEEIKLYFLKNASFSKATLKNKLTRLYNATFAIEKLEDNSKLASLIGEFKSSYYEIPPMEIYGVGAGSFKTKSGFQGITHYFLNTKGNRWFTYTSTMPTYYEGRRNSIKDMYKGNAPWTLNCRSEELSRCHIKLVNAKINIEDRLSASEQCKGTVLNSVNIFNLNIEKFVFQDWLQLFEEIKEENYKLVFLKIKEFGKSDFDKIEQIFKLPLYDMANRQLNIRVEFSLEEKAVIEKLERLEKRNNVKLLLGKVFIAKAELNFSPITAYYEDGSIFNLTLD